MGHNLPSLQFSTVNMRMVLFRGRPMSKFFFYFSLYSIFPSEFPFIRQNKNGWKKVMLENF